MSQLSDLLRESADETGSGRTMMISLLEEQDQIDGGDRPISKWRTLKQRLRFDWVSCCGVPTLRLRQSETPIIAEEENDDDDEENSGQNRAVGYSDPGSGLVLVEGLDCLTRGTRNLAEALAEERLARGEHVTEAKVAAVPLMRLLAETDGCDTTTWMGSDPVCCVCMGREKGAAFIPCGHTYCRVCSREIWRSRGKCPLCNRSIYDVLDLY
uniref:RING-type domain-containing protein n=1 Tax=Noccaea caerulescens TaxID=107243 RepID=A0A1J3EVU0_NOCCA